MKPSHVLSSILFTLIIPICLQGTGGRGGKTRSVRCGRRRLRWISYSGTRGHASAGRPRCLRGTPAHAARLGTYRPAHAAEHRRRPLLGTRPRVGWPEAPARRHAAQSCRRGTQSRPAGCVHHQQSNLGRRCLHRRNPSALLRGIWPRLHYYHPRRRRHFQPPREITKTFKTFRTRDDYPWRVIAIGPGHGIRLSSGRLVAPVWISLGEGGNAHYPSHCATIYSDDRGVTWRAGEIVARHPDDLPKPSETAIVETEPGRVMVSIRNESPRNRRALAFSANGAGGWSKPEFHQALWEPICMAGLTRLEPTAPNQLPRLVFSNPASLELVPNAPPDRMHRQRIDLSLRFSLDGGKGWSAPKILESGPSAYSDLAVKTDETILCLYERGSRSPYEKITLARIPAAWLFE